MQPSVATPGHPCTKLHRWLDYRCHCPACGMADSTRGVESFTALSRGIPSQNFCAPSTHSSGSTTWTWMGPWDLRSYGAYHVPLLPAFVRVNLWDWNFFPSCGGIGIGVRIVSSHDTVSSSLEREHLRLHKPVPWEWNQMLHCLPHLEVCSYSVKPMIQDLVSISGNWVTYVTWDNLLEEAPWITRPRSEKKGRLWSFK